MQDITINGFTVIGVVPMFRADRIDEYVIAAVCGDRAVSACMRQLTDRQWYSGNYFDAHDPATNTTNAVVDMYLRAHIDVMPWDKIRQSREV